MSITIRRVQQQGDLSNLTGYLSCQPFWVQCSAIHNNLDVGLCRRLQGHADTFVRIRVITEMGSSRVVVCILSQIGFCSMIDDMVSFQSTRMISWVSDRQDSRPSPHPVDLGYIVDTFGSQRRRQHRNNCPRESVCVYLKPCRRLTTGCH